MSKGLEEALDYMSRGWRVTPIKRGTKRPLPLDWVNLATKQEQTEEQIRKLWSANDVQGVGIVTGAESGFFVLDVDTAEGKWGDETLADLEATHGELPPTVEVITGSGGRHLYYAWPSHGEVATNGGKLGPGLDIRGTGGQVVAPGTLHPDTGEPYEWEISSHPDHIPIAQPPAWLLDLLKPDPLAHSHYEDSHDGGGNAVAWDNFNLTASNEQVMHVLEQAGWKHLTTDKHGYIYAARPGGTKGKVSASIGKIARGVLYVFSENAPGFSPNSSYDPSQVVAHALFDNDIHSADEWLVEQGFGMPSIFAGDKTSQDFWNHLEVQAQRANEKAIERAIAAVDASSFSLRELRNLDLVTPKATRLSRIDGASLLYEGRIHSLVAQPESGKSWVAGYACIDEMMRGGRILYWDLEGASQEFIVRQVLMGLDGVPTEALDHSFYWNGGIKPNEVGLSMLHRVVEDHNITLVALDSVNRSMASAGAQINSHDDYNKWHDAVPKALSDKGVTVIMIDHVAKDRDSRGNYAVGTEQKLAQADVSLGLEVVEPFGRGVDGTIGLRVLKDRPGGLARSCFGEGSRKRWGLFHLRDDLDREPFVDSEGDQQRYKKIEIEPWEHYKTRDTKEWRDTYPAGLMSEITERLVDWDTRHPGDWMDGYLLSLYVKCTDKLFAFAMFRLVDLDIVQMRRDEEDGQEEYRMAGRYGYAPQQDPMNLDSYDPTWTHEQVLEELEERARII